MKASEFPERKLYHVSGWEELKHKKINDSFILEPGRQGAEGAGVYFALDEPRFSAAEGARDKDKVVVVIEPENKRGWWISKGSVKKYNRPKTWHSDNKMISCTVREVEEIDGIKYLHCNWAWLEE